MSQIKIITFPHLQISCLFAFHLPANDTAINAVIKSHTRMWRSAELWPLASLKVEILFLYFLSKIFQCPSLLSLKNKWSLRINLRPLMLSHLCLPLRSHKPPLLLMCLSFQTNQTITSFSRPLYILFLLPRRSFFVPLPPPPLLIIQDTAVLGSSSSGRVSPSPCQSRGVQGP